MISYHNPEFIGAPSIPEAVGDRFYAQDLFRTFRYNQDYLGEVQKTLYNNNKIIIKGLIITQGVGHTIDITTGKGLINFSVEIQTGAWVIPPSTTNADITVFVEIPIAITNQAITGAVTDGVTTNYAKLAYIETDGQTRTRAKKAGSYAFEKIPAYVLTVDNIAPTAYELELARFTSNGATITFTGAGTRTDNTLNKADSFEIEDTLFVDSTNKKVGINTVTPSDILTVFGPKNLGNNVDDRNVISRFLDSFQGHGSIGNFRIMNYRWQTIGADNWHNSAIRLESDIDDVVSSRAWIDFRHGTSASDVSLFLGAGTTEWMSLEPTATKILQSSNATSKDTGALIIADGGVGIEQDLWLGGDINHASNLLLKAAGSEISIDTNGIILEANSQDKLTITNTVSYFDNGNVGINITNPSDFLTVFGSADLGNTVGDTKNITRFLDSFQGSGSAVNFRTQNYRWQTVGADTWNFTALRLESDIDDVANSKIWIDFRHGAATNDVFLVLGAGTTDWMSLTPTATTINQSTNATSKDTGALIVSAGGMGIEQDLWVGGAINHATNLIFKTAGVERARITSGGVFSTGGETDPDADVNGITLKNVESGTNKYFSLKANIDHGGIFSFDNDTFYQMRGSGSSGFIETTCINESGEVCINMEVLSRTSSTVTNNAAIAFFMITADKHDGAGTKVSVAADDNIFAIRTGVSNPTQTKFLVKGDGDFFSDSATAGGAGLGNYQVRYFDDENDILLSRTLRKIIGNKKIDKSLTKYKDKLNELGIMQDTMISGKGMYALSLGTAEQLFNMIKGLANKFDISENELFDFAKQY